MVKHRQPLRRKDYFSGQGLAVMAVALLFVAGCGLVSRKVAVGEEFSLRPGDKVAVAGTDLTITLKGVGRQWFVDQRAESSYADLIVTGGGAAARSLTLGESTTVGDYTLKLIGANPFRNNGGPDCKLVVARR